MNIESMLYAFLLTFLAGISTGIGSLISLLSNRISPKILSISLGFSAGVMIYVSFVEILNKALSSLISISNQKFGYIIAFISFFAGIALIAIIDNLIPSYENPHEIQNIDEKFYNKEKNKSKKLYKVGLLSSIAIFVHNFPEGIATFMSALTEPYIGVSIAIAVAIHNIPEGIAVSMPIYYSTNDRKKAFIISFLSGFAEPLGAIIGFLIIKLFINEFITGVILSVVSGIMIYISLDELLPTAEEYGEHHLAIGGLIAGMFIIGFTLIFLK